MLARCLSASLQGLEARPVVVEVDLAPGLPGVQLVGLPDKAIQEYRERVRSALRNSGFRGPLVRVVINLAPADLRKEGPSFDLPIALALLVASGQLARPQLEGLWCAGELGLDGSLRPSPAARGSPRLRQDPPGPSTAATAAGPEPQGSALHHAHPFRRRPTAWHRTPAAAAPLSIAAPQLLSSRLARRRTLTPPW